jgi:hypothetical protein
MRLLKRLPIAIAVILVLTLFIVPAAAELNISLTDDGKTLISNGTYWISWDPIGDHIVGDQFFINGTTNLSAGTKLGYSFIAPTGGCRTKICTGKSPGIGGDIIFEPSTTPGINKFFISINTTDLQNNVFIFLFDMIPSRLSNPSEFDAFSNHGLVDSSILLFSEDYRGITERSRTTHPDAGISYWISVSNVVEYTRPCYQLTGTTNLPPGETLSYSFFDPTSGVQGLYQGGIVVPGEKSGINRFIIPVNTHNSTEWINVIVWNPRYNTSNPSDSISTSMEFRPSSAAQNVSTTCSVTLPVTTPASPLSMMGTCGALFVILCIFKLTR